MVTSDTGKRWTDRLLTRRYMVSAAIVAGILSVGRYAYWRFRTIGTVVTFLRVGQYDPGEILLRTLSPDDDVLLIGPINSADGNAIRLGGPNPFRADASIVSLVVASTWKS